MNAFGYHRCILSLAILLAILIAGPAPAQTNFTGLTVSGAVEQPLTLTLSDLAKMPRTKLTVREKDGNDTMFDGVAVSEILKRAKPRLIQQCCSNGANSIVVIHAADGYRALFSMPELDPEFTNHTILLADRREGKSINGLQGPLRLIASDDKVRTRWVRQVNAIEILMVGGSTNSLAQ